MVLRLYTFIFISLLFIYSCSNQTDQIDKLDKKQSFKGLALGDSLYSTFYDEVRETNKDYSNIERQIFGYAITNFKEFDHIDTRFIYGVLMGDLYASSINGEITEYAFIDRDSDSLSKIKLRDSLFANYGEPTLRRDTSYTILQDVPVEMNRNVWRSKNVELIHLWGTDGQEHVNNLFFRSLKHEEAFNHIQQLIEKKTGNFKSGKNEFKKIGDLNLFTTKENLLKKGILKKEVVDYSTDYSNTLYRVDYDKYLESFFKIRNSKINKYSDNKAIETELLFRSNSDSLYRVELSFEKTIGSYGSEDKFVAISDLTSSLNNQLGKYSFQEKIIKPTGEYRAIYWLSDDVKFELQEYQDFISVDIYVDSQPTSLLGFLNN